MLKFSGYSYLIGGPKEAEHRLVDKVDQVHLTELPNPKDPFPKEEQSFVRNQSFSATTQDQNKLESEETRLNSSSLYPLLPMMGKGFYD
jgi:hypothetical protein